MIRIIRVHLRSFAANPHPLRPLLAFAVLLPIYNHKKNTPVGFYRGACLSPHGGTPIRRSDLARIADCSLSLLLSLLRSRRNPGRVLCIQLCFFTYDNCQIRRSNVAAKTSVCRGENPLPCSTRRAKQKNMTQYLHALNQRCPFHRPNVFTIPEPKGFATPNPGIFIYFLRFISGSMTEQYSRRPRVK